ncbi:MAG: hypothetical protein JRN12_07465 [Nitrososphaerota archaeon]|nr:hypothetical protein [Nitrososphaerota archaeon]
MRRGMVIAGAVVLVLGVAVAGVGIYFLVDQSGLGNIAASAQKTSVVLAPGASLTVGTAQSGKVAIVAYSDNLSAPIQVTSSGTTPTTRTTGKGGTTEYIAVFAGIVTGAAPIVISNNQTATASVQYAAVVTSIGAIASGGLLALGGGALFVIGLIVLIVGVVLKKKADPSAPAAPQM